MFQPVECIFSSNLLLKKHYIHLRAHDVLSMYGRMYGYVDELLEAADTLKVCVIQLMLTRKMHIRVTLIFVAHCFKIHMKTAFWFIIFPPLSVHLSTCNKFKNCQTDFHEICYLAVLLKFITIFQMLLKSDNNNGHLTLSLTCMSVCI
jgi:hypothetical protein